MTIEQYKNTLPNYAKDITLNLSSLHAQYEQSGLTDAQFYGSALAVAYRLKNQRLIAVYEALVNDLHEPLLKQAIKTAVTIMAMNNVFYRSLHFAEDKALMQMPAGLRMNGLRGHGIAQEDFEIFALAVSAINGCGMCIQSHIRQLVTHGFERIAINTIIRISAVLAAADQVDSLREGK